MSEPLSDSTAAPGPDSVGGYRVLHRIGEGGMGVVHLAEDRLGRRVALKALKPHVIGDDESRQRLDREVASLSKVRSRHVAEILDADPWGSAPYVVTRYVPGHSLTDVVKADGPLSDDDLAHVAGHLLEAVRDVHAAGVLHRDLKPTNVVMEGRSPVLIDFGLARLAEDPRLTAAGFLLGTPGYLAPEVLLGDDATAATDVHGWAATLVFAASGHSPYGAGHTMAILDRTRRGQVDLSGVPAWIRPVLVAALSVEPLDRPTIPELRAELDGLADAGHDTQLLSVAGADPAGAGGGAGGAAEVGPTLPWQLAGHPADDSAGHSAGQSANQGDAPYDHTRDGAFDPTGDADATTTLEPVAATSVLPAAATAPATSVMPTAAAPATRVLPQNAPDPTTIQRAQPVQPVPPIQTLPVARPAQGTPPVGPVSPAPRMLTGADRARRSLLLIGLLVVVAAGVALAPYLMVALTAVGTLLARGHSTSVEASDRRRAMRGPRWTDPVVRVLAYPWHLVRGSLGTLLLLGWTASAVAGTGGILLALGVATPTALLAAGAALGLGLWWGPGSRRVRHSVGRIATATAVRPSATAFVGAALVAVAFGTWLAQAQLGTQWMPATEAPWESLPSVAELSWLRDLVPRGR